MKPESNRPITIEDLLRLKRAERPAAEFWSTFDQELRAKQLAALVGKRPWWQTLPMAFFRLGRYRIALGASAVVAVTFFSVHDRQPTSATQPETVPAAGPVVIQDVPAAAPILFEPAYELAGAEMPVEPAPVAQNEDLAPQSAAPAVVAVAQVQPSEEPRALPMEWAIMAARDADSEPPPTTRGLVLNVGAVSSLDSVSTHSLLDVNSEFETRAMPARVAVEPLQQMRPPGETRRSRLLTAMVSSASLESSTRTTARAASRIEEERLYDQIHRFGARGDRVRIRF